MTSQWSTTTRYLVGIALAIALIFTVYLARPIIPMLVLAALLAFALRPVIRMLVERLHLSIGLAIALTYIGLIGAAVIALLFLVPSVVSAVRELSQSVADLFSQPRETTEYLAMVREAFPFAETLLQRLDQLWARLPPSMRPASPPVEATVEQILVVGFPQVVEILRWVGTAAFTALGALLISWYLSRDAGKFQRLLLERLPGGMRGDARLMIGQIGGVWDAFFRGQLLLMLIIGGVVTLGGLALGLPYAPAFGLLSAVMELVPAVGPAIAMIPAVAVALIFGSTHLEMSNAVFALIVLGFYLLVQQVGNTVIVPRVMGRAVGLHPIVIILGVIVFAAQWGILGALVAAPSIATAAVLLNWAYARVNGQDPFPSGEAPIAGSGRALTESLQIIGERLRQRFGAGADRPPAADSAAGDAPGDG